TPVMTVEPGRPERDWHRDQRRVGDSVYADVVMLAWARAETHNDPGHASALRKLWQRSRAWAAPAFPLKGRDALEAGLPPGPAAGRLLADVEAWWEASDYGVTREECLAKMRELATK